MRKVYSKRSTRTYGQPKRMRMGMCERGGWASVGGRASGWVCESVDGRAWMSERG